MFKSIFENINFIKIKSKTIFIDEVFFSFKDRCFLQLVQRVKSQAYQKGKTSLYQALRQHKIFCSCEFYHDNYITRNIASVGAL